MTHPHRIVRAVRRDIVLVSTLTVFLLGCGQPPEAPAPKAATTPAPAEEAAVVETKPEPAPPPGDVPEPDAAPPEGGYSLSVHPEVLPDGQVHLAIESNVPGTIQVMAGVDLAGQKPDDPYIGTSERVTVVDGRGEITLDVGELPAGRYEAVVSFYPRWGFADDRSRRTGIAEPLEAIEPVRLSGSGESVEAGLRRRRGQRWVMDHVGIGTAWDASDWQRRFGQPESVTPDRWNPEIIKGYYYPAIDVTVFVNVLEGEVTIWRLGRATH